MNEDDEMTREDIKLKQELDRMLAKVREAVERLEAMPSCRRSRAEEIQNEGGGGEIYEVAGILR